MSSFVFWNQRLGISQEPTKDVCHICPYYKNIKSCSGVCK